MSHVGYDAHLNIGGRCLGIGQETSEHVCILNALPGTCTKVREHGVSLIHERALASDKCRTSDGSFAYCIAQEGNSALHKRLQLRIHDMDEPL